ncbi:SLAC1 family transporter [Corynebacterium pyruviciproducens]
MGTSIVARLLVEEHLHFLASIFAVIACAILVELTVGFARYREPSFRRTTMAEWSMYFIGILALGAALSGLTGNSLFRLIGFWIGGPVTVITWGIQLTRFHGDPKFTWGLPLVGPMISASVAGWLARDYGSTYHVMGTVLFCMSLFTAVPTFAGVYWAAWHGKVDFMGAKSATAWVPLGVVGQSTTAMQILYPGPFSILYGRVALVIAIPPGDLRYDNLLPQCGPVGCLLTCVVVMHVPAGNRQHGWPPGRARQRFALARRGGAQHPRGAHRPLGIMCQPVY